MSDNPIWGAVWATLVIALFCLASAVYRILLD